jgi:geranylgeranyl pyrophosphate synthase
MQPALGLIRNSLQADKLAVEQELMGILERPDVHPTPLRQAMSQAVLEGGQRWRPILALRIARLAGLEGRLTRRAAAAVEILHCASLVVDDLPCMDNAELRRGRPTIHRRYGEPTALLAGFGLVALAARSVVDACCLPEEMPALVLFQSKLLKALDASGLCEGQDLDVRLTGDERDKQRHRINELKTVPLFELSARAGLLGADANTLKVRLLCRFARELGRAYQAADDYLDGEVAHLQVVETQLSRARSCLGAFRPDADELEELIQHIHERCLSERRPAHLCHR